MPEFQVGQQVRVVQHVRGFRKRIPVGNVTTVRDVQRMERVVYYGLVGDGDWVYREEELVAVVPLVEHVAYLITYVAKQHLLELDWETNIYSQTSKTLEDAEGDCRWLEQHEYLVLSKKLVKIKFNKPEVFENAPIDEDDNLIEDEDDGEF